MLAALAVCGCAVSAMAEPLRIGFTECYRDRLPLDFFAEAYPEIAVEERPFARNPFGAADSPLPLQAAELPDVFSIVVGRYSDDLRDLADRGLIEPLDDLLEAIGVSPDDFLPQTMEAVRYRGQIWALPHHLVVDALHYDQARFEALGLAPAFDSWEALFETMQQYGPPEIMLPFSSNQTLFGLAELMAQTTGGAPIDYAAAEAWQSDRMAAALDLISGARDRRLLEFRIENEPLRVKATALAGTGRVESLYPTSHYAVMPYPRRLLRDDPPAECAYYPGLLEAFVVRSGTEAREQAVAFLSWLMLEDTEWEVFLRTNAREGDRPFVMDSVHVPLRPSVWQTVDFDYAFKKFPELDTLRGIVEQAYIAATPAALDKRAVTLASDTVMQKLGGAASATWLDALCDAVRLQVKNTPVESHAYDAY